MWKANIKTIKKQHKTANRLMKNQCKESIRQSKEMMSRNYDTLLRQHVLELNHYKNSFEQLQNENKTLNKKIEELEDQKWKLHKIVGKYQQEVKQ